MDLAFGLCHEHAEHKGPAGGTSSDCAWPVLMEAICDTERSVKNANSGLFAYRSSRATAVTAAGRVVVLLLRTSVLSQNAAQAGLTAAVAYDRRLENC